MARTADHDARRRQVAEALMRTVAARGLARTALVDVAAEAGVSVGLVQRYFRSKSDLICFGVEYLYERTEERIGEIELVPPVRTLVTRIMTTLLPLGAERRVELAVWLEFIAVALTDQRMSAIHKAATRRLVDGIVQALEGAQRRGELSPDVDARAEAAALVAFVDGLSLHHLATQEDFDGEALQRALTAYFNRLFDQG
jgi:TetR/AcrR family transcriptional regulator, transcriptional repressor of bet genes